MSQDIIADLFRIVLIPLLAALTTFGVKWLNAKAQSIRENTDNEMLNKYLGMLAETITNCVIATNQTYVDSLKKTGSFDKDAQKVAFKATYESVMAILSEDAKEYLSNALGDLETYIVREIEANVKVAKSE